MRQIAAALKVMPVKTNTRGSSGSPARDLLLIDESERLHSTLSASLEQHGFSVATCRSAREALFAVETLSPGYAVIELKLPDDCGLKLLSRLKIASPEMTLVMLTGHASIATAIEAI